MTGTWEQTQLAKLLPLDSESILQVLEYTSTLSQDAAAEHLKALLGDSSKALEFISSYNSRRQQVQPSTRPVDNEQPSDGVPRKPRKAPKQKAPLHQLASRQVEAHSEMIGGYLKGAGDDYMKSSKTSSSSHKTNRASGSAFALSEDVSVGRSTQSIVKPPAAGKLLSDLPNVKAKSQANSRIASPAPAKAKVTLTGGTPSKGASSSLEDLDSAIRSLEIQTNPSLLGSASAQERQCTCNATRHPLLTAAPNCLNCGKIICLKQGIGPCTFCGNPLLSNAEIQAMVESLRQERGQQRQQVNNAAHRRADVTGNSHASSPFGGRSGSSTPSKTPAAAPDQIITPGGLEKALQHRDRLLTFQSQNAQRSTVRDEAADFATPSASGTSIWASPAERARQLRQQQAALREQEWSDKPEWEKRTTVLNIEIGGKGKGKASGGVNVKKETGTNSGEAPSAIPSEDPPPAQPESRSMGMFSNNPLLQGRADLIHPVWRKQGDSSQTMSSDAATGQRGGHRYLGGERVVQDDLDDNEDVILDGGVYGYQESTLDSRPAVPAS